RLVRRGRHSRRLPQHRARLERPEPPRPVGHIRSPLVFAHIRAAIGSAVQETNCHPFRYGKWLFMHNGFIGDFQKVRRDLVLAIDPSLFPLLEGSADTEVFFYLALTL